MKSEKGHNTRLNSVMLVATFFSLWLAVYFEDNVEDALAYALILSFGILHGANDIKLLQATRDPAEKSAGFFRILFYYVGFVIVVAGLFFLIPALALLLFIVFSAYHFGEQHWNTRFNGKPWEESLFYTSYGLVVLFLLFSAHKNEVNSIVLKICGLQLPLEYYDIILAMAAILFVVLYTYKIRQFNSDTIREIFYLLVFFIVFNTASLLWGFAIYFIIWHSIPSLADQIRYLYGDFNKKNFISYLRSSGVYWAVSVMALIVIFIFIEDTSEGFLPFLFSFLAAITFPHVFVISRLNQR